MDTRLRHGPRPSGAIALEHLTGPSRGTTTWLSGATFDVAISAHGLVRVTEARAGGPEPGAVARLRCVDDRCEIEAFGGHPVWVNGVPVTRRRLQHRDMVEFGETGPLSRLRLYRENQPLDTNAGRIVGDAVDYLRVSRKPLARRLGRAVCDVPRRLASQTTVLFRVGVVATLVALAALASQQHRLNLLLQRQIDSGATRLDSVARALARARDEALTPHDLEALRVEIGRRLSTEADRVTALEDRSQAGSRVIADSAAAVVLLQAAYGFRETASGRILRHVVDAAGRPRLSPFGQPLLSLEGDGPVAERQITGTAFAVGRDGVLVTNRHVALPWEEDTDVERWDGLEPMMIRFIAYVTGESVARPVELVQASADADLALLRPAGPTGAIRGLGLADAPPAPGDEVIVLGYPTGLRSLLAQAGPAFIEELQQTNDTEFWSVAARLAQAHLIAPLASRGIVAQVTGATIVYDAETTMGGSGGPVLDVNGDVVAVNAAILPEYGGSNLGVPVAMVRALLADAGMRF